MDNKYVSDGDEVSKAVTAGKPDSKIEANKNQEDVTPPKETTPEKDEDPNFGNTGSGNELNVEEEPEILSGTEGSLSADQQFYLQKRKMYIDLIKWIVVSGIFGWVSMMFTQAIQDRQQGINEIKLYDDYLEYVLNNKLDKSYQLARYFSTVTASEDLRDGWKRYYDEIKPEYISYKEKVDSPQWHLDSLAAVLPTKKGKDSLDIVKEITSYSTEIVNIEKKYNPILIEKLEEKVIDLKKLTVYIQYSTSEEGARRLADTIKNLGCLVPPIEKKALYTKNAEIRYFKEEDQKAAAELGARIKKKIPGYDMAIVPFLAYKDNVKKGIIEIWIK